MVMFLVSNEIKLLHLSTEDHSNPEFKDKIAELIKLEVFDIEKDGIPEGFEQAVYNKNFSEQAKRYLEDDLDVKIENSDSGLFLWISMTPDKMKWIRIPIGDYEGKSPMELVIFMSVLLTLSLIGAWLLVSQLHRPLKRLAFAARELGRGDYPGKLKEVGPQELIELTAAFNQMASDVRKLEEDRTLLLAGISHDLRTPITRIRLALEFLSDTDNDIKEGIIQDTEDVDDIIDQFIGYVRFGSEEQLVEADITELIMQVVEASSKQHTGIELDLKKLSPVKFKPLAMKRLISNLIENAYRYGKAPVHIATEEKENKIYLSVTDHGKGIEDLDKLHLFQPFARGEKARSGKGSGLGLAIVSRIAEMHGGEIRLQNKANAGLQATLILPINQQEE